MLCGHATQCEQFETPLESMTQTDSLKNRSLLIYQRHEAAFARHMEDIQFHIDVSSNWKQGGDFGVAWPCHHSTPKLKSWRATKN